jgi:hypothetical protein
VTIAGHPSETESYVWGDRTIRTVRCRHCGCVTHWELIDEAAHPNAARMCVNLRNFEPEAIGPVRVRRFDGAVSWAYLADLDQD